MGSFWAFFLDYLLQNDTQYSQILKYNSEIDRLLWNIDRLNMNNLP